MNKIFKVVWSKVKHCYVVVSEIAKNTISGGARRSRVRKGALAAALVTTVLGSSFAMPNSAWADMVMGRSYEALIILSAVTDEGTRDTTLGITLYRGDYGKQKDANGKEYVYLSNEKDRQGNYKDSDMQLLADRGVDLSSEGYFYTKVSASASADFTQTLNQTINQTVVNDIVTMINSGQNAVAIPTYSQTQKTDSSGNLLYYDNDGKETTQNTNNPVYTI